jgi:hypothetical protein
MLTVVEPEEKFRHLTEVEIMQALDDPDPGNAIAIEVARLIQGYTANFQRYVQRTGRIPTDILHVTPRSPIEAVAMRLTAETIRQSLR